jgi:hypothetical protein
MALRADLRRQDIGGEVARVAGCLVLRLPGQKLFAKLGHEVINCLAPFGHSTLKMRPSRPHFSSRREA